MIKIISHNILRKLLNNIGKSKIFAIMAGGIKDITGIERESICIGQRARPKQKEQELTSNMTQFSA